MRIAFIMVCGLGLAFMAGWFTIQKDGEDTTIKFNRDEIRQDTRTAIDRGKRYLKDRAERNQSTGDLQYESNQQSYDANSQVYDPNQQYSEQPYYGQTQPAGYQQPVSDRSAGSNQPREFDSRGQFSGQPIQYAPGQEPYAPLAPRNQEAYRYDGQSGQPYAR